MATYVVGFEEETYRDYLHGLKQIFSYDPDQIQTLYVTPHRWTPYYRMASERRVILTDKKKWDYKHQVLATRYMSPWKVLFWVKLIEAVVQLRPRSIWRVIAHPDLAIRAAMRWYYQIGRRVWFYEIWNSFSRDKQIQNGPKLHDFWGAPQDNEDAVMRV